MTKQNNLRAVLVDDEVAARNSLARLLLIFCPTVEIVGEASGITDGFKLINQKMPDLVFLDIEMEEGSGFDLLALFSETPFRIIFVTAHDGYAVKAFRANALDYLLKPVDPELLVLAVRKQSQFSLDNSYQLKVANLVKSRHLIDKIVLPCSDGLIFQSVSEVVHIEADDNYTHFFLTTGKHFLISKTLKDVETLLPADGFCRVHKSHLVNISHIERFVNRDGGYLILSNNKQVPVSKRKKQEFLDRFS